MFPELFGHLRVKNAFFPEQLVSIRFQDFGPFVGIIPRAVTACKNMREGRRKSTPPDQGQNEVVFQDCFFKTDNIRQGDTVRIVPGHIQHPVMQLPYLGVPGKKIPGVQDPPCRSRGQGFSCLVMHGEGL